MSSEQLPTTLLEATRYFANPEVCVQFVARLRWPNGPECPACGGLEHSYLTTRRMWKCKNRECRKQFSVKVGSIFEDSAIPLDKWLCSIWLIANAKNGISSHELGRSVGLTQKSAWFVLHRIRLAMQAGSFDKFDGEVEVDETFIGGKAKNMHADKRRRKITATGPKDKAVIVGARHRDTGEVRASVVPDRTKASLLPFVTEHVQRGGHIYTDKHQAYNDLFAMEYRHETVDHAIAYVEGRVHTNGLEAFWSLLKRGLAGTYIAVNAAHLRRYVEERLFTYNLRHLSDLERFQTVLDRVDGRRLTYAELIA